MSGDRQKQTADFCKPKNESRDFTAFVLSDETEELSLERSELLKTISWLLLSLLLCWHSVMSTGGARSMQSCRLTSCPSCHGPLGYGPPDCAEWAAICCGARIRRLLTKKRST